MMSESNSQDPPFKVCSICRAPIPFDGPYYRCSVSTCNRSRTAYYFCSVGCWDAHVPTMRHRDAWAEEARAPSRAQWLASEEGRAMVAQGVTRKIQRPQHPSAMPAAQQHPSPMPAAQQHPSPMPAAQQQGSPHPHAPRLLADDVPDDVLVVVSKLKAYVKARGDLKTSDTVVPVLSDILRQVCDEAMLRAREAGRQTILDRDIPRRWRPMS